MTSGLSCKFWIYENEAAVAFLALKELDAYSYNNAAYTDLYKVQGEDQKFGRILQAVGTIQHE